MYVKKKNKKKTVNPKITSSKAGTHLIYLFAWN